MKRLIGALFGACCLLLGVPNAHATFIDGWLAECTAVTSTTCTELTGTGYARQAVSFSDPTKGFTVNRAPYTFGPATGTLAGHAIYDAATGGNLLVVIPLASSYAASGANPDAGDVGALGFTVTGMASVANSATYSANIAAGATFATTSDGSTVSAVQQAAITKGNFAARAAGVDAAYTRLVPTTGFTTTVGNNVSTLILEPAGTIAAGTVTTPAAPADGQVLRIVCGATVTSLTVTANSGQTVVSAPTTCTAAQGHELRYALGVTKWYTAY